jgi:hypothetical protein
MTWKTGARYEGNFSSGDISGQGTMTKPDGTKETKSNWGAKKDECVIC